MSLDVIHLTDAEWDRLRGGEQVIVSWPIGDGDNPLAVPAGIGHIHITRLDDDGAALWLDHQ